MSERVRVCSTCCWWPVILLLFFFLVIDTAPGDFLLCPLSVFFVLSSHHCCFICVALQIRALVYGMWE